ncbi:MAG: cellulase family glycosylhydrolase, partial [Longimicrobiales bacterium]|nr:cellulase family glycosylhydrolase [Longimicrobiales bacterium]
PAIDVLGPVLVNGQGERIRLRGVNRSGTEYMCVQGHGIFDGPVDDAAIEAMVSWEINVVRVPLNAQCWLGVNGIDPASSGQAYRDSIAAFVYRLNDHGLVAILDLHWSAPDTVLADGQRPMPDRDHVPAFWAQVAKRFGGNRSVVLDLFNEPHPDGNSDSPEAWRCWRDGGTCAGLDYQAAGMRELVDTVRAAGAENVILLAGVRYASSLLRWLEYAPDDPLDRLAASWHVYSFSGCSTRHCWDTQIDPVTDAVPVVLGEFGQDDGGSDFVTGLMDWMDARDGNYLAWVWNVWGSPLDLIRSYNGIPTEYGATFHDRFTR